MFSENKTENKKDAIVTATVAWNPSKSYLGPKCTSSESTKLPKVQNTSTTATKVSGSLQLTFRNVTNMLLEGVVRIVSYVHVPLCDSLTNLKEISSWVMIAALFQPNSSTTLVTPSTAQDSEGMVWKDEEKRCRSLSASEEDAYETWSGDMICVTARDIYSIAVKL